MDKVTHHKLNLSTNRQEKKVYVLLGSGFGWGPHWTSDLSHPPQPKGHTGFARVIRAPEIPVGLQQPMALPSIKTTFNYFFLFPPYPMGTTRGHIRWVLWGAISDGYYEGRGKRKRSGDHSFQEWNVCWKAPPPNCGRQNTACNVPSNYTKGIKAGDLRPLSSIIQPASSHMTQGTGTLVPPAPLDDSMSRANMVMIPCLTSLMMFMNFVSLIS